MSNSKKKLKVSKDAYRPHTCIARTGLLLGRAVVSYTAGDPDSSDSRDLRIIARVMFRDGYQMALAERRVHAMYLSKKKKGGGK